MSELPVQDGLPPNRRLWAILAIALAVGMASLDVSIANTALPTIARDLNTSPAASVWVVSAYQLAVVMSLLPLASLGEIHGYRRVYLGGVALFAVASLLCALSTTLPQLTAARALQGRGSGGIMSVNTALIRFIYPSRALGRGLGFNALTVGVSTAAGPTVAAGILSFAAWPWLFAVNVPVGLMALCVAFRVLPESPRTGHRFDGIGAMLSAATFGALILGIGEGAHEAGLWLTLGLILLAIVCAALLVRWQRDTAAPMLPVDLYRRPMFALSSATSVCSFAAQGLSFVALPFYFQTMLGRSAVEAGLLLTPWPVMTAIMAPIAGNLSDRFPAAILGGIGMAILALGLALLAALPEAPGQIDIVWRMMLCGTGFGFFQSPNLRAIMSSAPRERSGSASGVVATSRLTGQSTGAALVALCFGLSATHGPALALVIGAVFAGAASLASFSRLLAPRVS